MAGAPPVVDYCHVACGKNLDFDAVDNASLVGETHHLGPCTVGNAIMQVLVCLENDWAANGEAGNSVLRVLDPLCNLGNLPSSVQTLVSSPS